MTISSAILLVLIGVGTGVYGTVIGVGGGFVIVPLLLFLYPKMNPSIVTSISLAVIFFNALSGTVAYAQLRRIDYRIGIPYSLATIPGAVLGARFIALISRDIFNIVFGLFLTAASLVLVLRPEMSFRMFPGDTERIVVDQGGYAYSYRTNLWWGIGLSFLAGFVASLLGLGGGIIHVPVLITLLQFPAHIATATSHFMLVITSLSASVTHLFSGDFSHVWFHVLLLALGVIPGAQVGARLSSRLKGRLIVRLLALALLLVGLRLIIEGVA